MSALRSILCLRRASYSVSAMAAPKGASPGGGAPLPPSPPQSLGRYVGGADALAELPPCEIWEPQDGGQEGKFPAPPRLESARERQESEKAHPPQAIPPFAPSLSRAPFSSVIGPREPP